MWPSSFNGRREETEGCDVCHIGVLSGSPGGTQNNFSFRTALAPEKGQKFSAGKGIYDIDHCILYNIVVYV